MASTSGRRLVLPLTNKSGGSVAAGDVVIVDTTNDTSFTTTTFAAQTLAVGIAQETIANNGVGRVLLSGYASLVNVSASVTRGHYGKTHTVAKQATGVASRTAGAFCQFLTGGATPTAYVWGIPDFSAGSFSADDHLPWHQLILPIVQTPDATTGTWALLGFTESLTTPFVVPGATNPSGYVALFNSTSAQNDAIAWDVILAAGTWDMHVHVRKSSNTGIITLNQDGVSQGTVDTYAAAAAYAKLSITGWTVASTGKKRMQLKAATKNASSSSYLLELIAIDFRRTA